MATFNKFQSFVEALAEKVHNLQSDTLRVALSNSVPLATNTVLANITQIANGNGYTTGGTSAAQVSSQQTSGTYKLVLNDVTFTATSGSIGPFQYVVLSKGNVSAILLKMDDTSAWVPLGSSFHALRSLVRSFHD